ncbi:phosphoribosylanthranilate isomerase [Nocardia bhagyanarayanae]|uniref:N-(5'-phosphoribosyl)anthranilate isomerase n=1 Tax=Nocardia bhagyanarayanae TaxID=1215925 RepID=A0A543EWG5_9NOCA|nr:phosphoribosylanthranilate isomerase [Nocardia bhagyanarayanae]TQM25938.1 phosphoribosylanthranilate isomerase [Nocardia bhagyanarayanae]
MPVRAKLCGIRSESDLRIAIDAGADAVGFIAGVTHVSEDALDTDRAAWLAGQTPPFVTRVLVTHLGSAEAILELAEHVDVDAVQIHGLVTGETVRQVRSASTHRIIRAVHVTGPEAVGIARAAAADCDAVLLDSRTTDRLGGTGRTHDWSVSAAIVDELRVLGRPVILAGGLNTANVGDAIRKVRPFAVDVNSGVEHPSGDKSADACADFVTSARLALP